MWYIVSPIRLLIKCAEIGTRIFSLFRYRIAMHIPKMNAEKIDPKLWREAKRIEEHITAKIMGTIKPILFKNTPLNSNSSAIGEIKTTEIKEKTLIHSLLSLAGIKNVLDGKNWIIMPDK